MSQIIILGAGFGGLSSANELHRLLGDKHKIILIDRKKKFSVGASNLWVMLGKRSRESCEKEISLIENKGIKFVNEDIVDINTDEKRVYTTTNYFKYDYLIIALGTELYPEAVMGFKESALNLYEMAGAHDISQEIEKFYRGRIVILMRQDFFLMNTSGIMEEGRMSVLLYALLSHSHYLQQEKQVVS